MPSVSKNELLQVVREVWGYAGAPTDDQAKMVLAEALIREAWEQGNKSGVEINFAGTFIKAALGNKWEGASERHAQGKPNLRQLLSDDPYFVVRNEEGHKQYMVKLRISRLAKLIGNQELIAEYRSQPDADDAATSHPWYGQQDQAVALTDDGLPIRPGQRACPHYLKFGWCLFKQDCWYSHPPIKQRAGRTIAGAGSNGRDPPLFESDLEAGVMLINGVYPLRPGKKPCGFYLNHGWCAFKAKCRLHHPPPAELAALQAQEVGAAGQRAGAISPATDDSFNGSAQEEGAPSVKQPPLQVLLGIIIDSVWPPGQSAESCAKGALAKYMVESQAHVVQECLLDTDAEITVPGPTAGSALNGFWSKQKLYNPVIKPHKTGLANMLDADPLFIANRAAETNSFTLRLGQLITDGAKAASRSLAVMCDAVWPPHSGKDAWLRGSLAKWLLQAGFEGNNGEVLRQVLAVGTDSPTVFRIDVAQAGEYLRRSWSVQPHPYDSTSQPWTQLKPLIADDRFFYLEPAPQKPNSQHVTLDLLDMLRQLPKIARAGCQVQQGAHTAANGSATGLTGAGSSSASTVQAQRSSSSSRAFNPGDLLDVDQGDGVGAANPLGVLLQASSAAAAVVEAWPHASAGPSVTQQRDPVTAAEADIATLEALQYVLPAEGAGARKMQRWWPSNKSDQQGFVWTEMAVRLLSPDGADAAQRVAEMVQHLEICPVLAVACSAYAQKPHLLQFFAPYASIGELAMPAAVYLLDIHMPGEHVQNYLSLVAPVLSSRDNIKICHSSKQWSGLLYRAYGLSLDGYFDTQQANYVYKALLRETGKFPSADLQRTSEASLTALLDSCGFYHPIRHADCGRLQWQNRPLSNELVTCAAADVAYLIPLMESQVGSICQAAIKVRQHQSQQRGRAALLSSLPQELTDTAVVDTLAKGVEGSRGGISAAKLGVWASLDAFHQVPWPPGHNLAQAQN